jgi:hypothetical protein
VDGRSEKEKQDEFEGKHNDPYYASACDFKKIPGSPIVYWLSPKVLKVFNNPKIGEIEEPRIGVASHNDDYFLKCWWEVISQKISLSAIDCEYTINNDKKWYPYNKGGSFRKWYGNNHFIVNFQNNGYELKNYDKAQVKNSSFYFKPGLTWSRISTTKFSLRYHPKGYIVGDAGPSAFAPPNKLLYLLSYLNSKLVSIILQALNPTFNYQVGTISKIPFNSSNYIEYSSQINTLTNECIKISQEEWDSRETSWDFKINELLNQKTSNKLEDTYDNYCDYWRDKYFQLHKNEEELNRLFIDIYDLEDELTPDVPLEDITILKNETQIEDGKLVFNKDVIVKQFISYAVGCMFGRYSPHKEGLILANQGEGIQEFLEKVPDAEFLPDEDAIIPILDEEYFTDDIVGRFKEFLKVTFGPEKLSENMDFIAHSLSSKGKKKTKSSEQVIRNYFLKDFYKDHVKMYKKRPIYWLFSSGKKRAFNALVYMHRYDRTTLARMRTEYLLELEGKMDAHREMLSSEDARNAKEKAKLAGYIEEIMAYDEVLKNKADAYIEIDLDDGVKENYKLFDGLVGKI